MNYEARLTLTYSTGSALAVEAARTCITGLKLKGRVTDAAMLLEPVGGTDEKGIGRTAVRDLACAIVWFLIKEGREAWHGEDCCDDQSRELLVERLAPNILARPTG